MFGPDNSIAKAKEGINKTVRGHPLNAIGRIRDAEHFIEQSHLGDMLRKVCDGRKCGQQKRNANKTTTDKGKKNPVR